MFSMLNITLSCGALHTYFFRYCPGIVRLFLNLQPFKNRPYLWAVGSCIRMSRAIGGWQLGNTPTLGGSGGACTSLEAVGVFLTPSPLICPVSGWMGNVWVWKEGTGLSAVWLWRIKLWVTIFPRATGGRLFGSGLKGGGFGAVGFGMKHMGGRLRVILGGMGGKDVLEVDGQDFTESFVENLVLSLGTGCSISPPDLLVSPVLGGICLGLGSGLCSAISLNSSFILDTCRSLGTGFCLVLSEGLTVSSCFPCLLQTELSSRGTDPGHALSFLVCAKHWVFFSCIGWGWPISCVLTRLANIRLRWPGRVIPIYSSWSAVRPRHWCNVASPALWNAAVYCSRWSPCNHCVTASKDSNSDMADVSDSSGQWSICMHIRLQPHLRTWLPHSAEDRKKKKAYVLRWQEQTAISKANLFVSTADVDCRWTDLGFTFHIQHLTLK